MSRLLALLSLGAMLMDTSLAFDATTVAAKTKLWMDTVAVQSDPTAVTALFCDDGVLVATAGQGIRFKTFSEDGWGKSKEDDVTIQTYFDWFATLPAQKITLFHDNIEKITDNVWVNNAWVNWEWTGNPGITARMTFVVKQTVGDDSCIFELHSSGVPDSPDDKPAPEDKTTERRLMTAADVATATTVWQNAVVTDSNPQLVTDQFCDDGLLVATAGQGIRSKTKSVDGWGNLKPEDVTIKGYFDWFATLPAQAITRTHNNIVQVTPDVFINNAWVDWTWEGNPGLVARMTYIFRKTPTGVCIFELHSSALPAAPAPLAPTTTMTALDSSASSNSGESSASMKSSGSGPAGSFNTGSMASDSSGSASSGSTASGSWGSELQIWQWCLILGLLCCCLAGAGAAAAGGKGKSKKKKSKKKAPAAEPAPVVEAVVEDPVMMDLPPLMPLATPMSMVAAPMVAAPMVSSGYTYAAAPAPYGYAAPATGGYTIMQPAATPGYYGTTSGVVSSGAVY